MEALFKEKIIADKIIEEVIGFVALFRRGEPLVMNQGPEVIGEKDVEETSKPKHVLTMQNDSLEILDDDLTKSNVSAVAKDKYQKCHSHNGKDYSCHHHKDCNDVVKPRIEETVKTTLAGIYFGI